MDIRLVNAILLILVSSAFGVAQEEKLKDLKGAIRQLDLKTGAVTLQLMYSDRQAALSLAAKEIPVTNPLGDKLKLADLREELRVTAKIRGEDEIVGLRIDGPYRYGAIKKVDADSRTIIYKDLFGDRTVKIPVEAKLVAAGAEVSFNELKVGGPVQILYSLDKKAILQVQTGKGTNIRDPFLRVIRYAGVLAELDIAKRHVQIVMQSTDAGLIRSYDVSPDALLRLQYHLKPIGEVGIDQFAKWVKVHYTVDRDTNRIINMDADLPVMLRRKVFRVEPARIVVEDELKEKTIPLAADVKVLTPRGEGKLSQVTANRIVTCGLSLDRTRVLVVYLWDQ